MKHFPLIIAGEEYVTRHGLEVRNPYNGEVVGVTHLASEQEFELAVAAAQQAREPFRQMPAFAKAEALNDIASKLQQRQEELSMQLASESAKPLRYAMAEIDRAIFTFRIAAEECKRLPDELLQLDWSEAGTGREGVVRHFPVGIVAGISPFNFPMNLAVHKIAPAIAAGCPIVLKPATSTPLSTLSLAQIINSTALPKGAVTVLPMSRAMGNALVTDPRFALLTFTGSPEVGWAMKAKAGKRKVVLELGGNAGVIVAQSANLDHAVARSLFGAFAYSGQVCIHAQRFFVHRSHYSSFIERMKVGAEALRMGSPLDPETEISAMIDEANNQRVKAWIDEAVAGGAQVLTGGHVRDGIFLPTILTQTSPHAKVCREEVFGPVITITPFDKLGDAIAQLNEGRFGLQAGIFTDSQSEIDLAFALLEVGGVIVNDVPTFRMDHMPYGGVKDSGLGREGVRYAMRDMLEPRILVKQRIY